MRRFLDAGLAGKESEFITANQLSETSEEDQQTIRRFLINDSFDGSSSDQKALQFQLDTSLSLMRASASSRMKTDVQLRLIEDQGLYLIWQDSYSQSIIDRSKIHSFLLSPWVRAIRYGYYESETDTWEYVEAIPESELSPLSQSKLLYSVLLDFEHPQTSKKLSLPIYLSAQVASSP